MAKLEYQIDQEMRDVFEAMRLRRGPALIVMTLEVNSLKTNCVINMSQDEFSSDSTSYDKVKELLHDEAQFMHKPCIVLFDHRAINQQSRAERNVVIAFRWNADGSKPQERMVYSSAWKSLSTYFSSNGVANTNDMFEVSDWDEVEDKMKKYQ